jgi:hypothetical protein
MRMGAHVPPETCAPILRTRSSTPAASHRLLELELDSEGATNLPVCVGHQG